jgi:hypothetical protein
MKKLCKSARFFKNHGIIGFVKRKKLIQIRPMGQNPVDHYSNFNHGYGVPFPLESRNRKADLEKANVEDAGDLLNVWTFKGQTSRNPFHLCLRKA